MTGTSEEVFVENVDPNGKHVATYFSPASLQTEAYDVAIDGQGGVWVVGTTESTAFLATGPVLSYVTGGFASAKVDANVTIPAAGFFTDTHTLYGWTVGAGIEYAFWNNWSLKGEYLYARFENQAYLFPATPVVPRGALNLDNHIVRIGLNWRYTDCVFWSCGGAVVAKY